MATQNLDIKVALGHVMCFLTKRPRHHPAPLLVPQLQLSTQARR